MPTAQRNDDPLWQRERGTWSTLNDLHTQWIKSESSFFSPYLQHITLHYRSTESSFSLDSLVNRNHDDSDNSNQESMIDEKLDLHNDSQWFEIRGILRYSKYYRFLPKSEKKRYKRDPGWNLPRNYRQYRMTKNLSNKDKARSRESISRWNWDYPRCLKERKKGRKKERKKPKRRHRSLERIRVI